MHEYSILKCVAKKGHCTDIQPLFKSRSIVHNPLKHYVHSRILSLKVLTQWLNQVYLFGTVSACALAHDWSTIAKQEQAIWINKFLSCGVYCTVNPAKRIRIWKLHPARRAQGQRDLVWKSVYGVRWFSKLLINVFFQTLYWSHQSVHWDC
jgi:hypothetical protein